MILGDIYNAVAKPVKSIGRSLSDNFGDIHYVAPTSTAPTLKPVEYKIPPVISPQHKKLFIEQAQKVGLHPDEFGTIARREQGSSTTPNQAAMVGSADPYDRGVMQVNRQNEPFIQTQFKTEYGRSYNPRSAVDSIIAARMVLEENKRQFEQMKANGTYTLPYTNQDLIDSYNTGVAGFVKAKQGDKEKQARLSRYQNAGQ